MIDNFEKTELLLTMLKEALPIRANVTRYLADELANKSPKVILPNQCNIVDVVYTGDMGGILCWLDGNEENAKSPVVVSITHLSFDRNIPLSRDIVAYQKHRVKKLKQQSRR